MEQKASLPQKPHGSGFLFLLFLYLHHSIERCACTTIRNKKQAVEIDFTDKNEVRNGWSLTNSEVKRIYSIFLGWNFKITICKTTN